MNLFKLKKITVFENNTFKQALKIIKLNGEGACFVVTSKYKLLGILTDGDVRKLILDKLDINRKIKDLYNKNVFSLSINTSTTKIQQKIAEGVKIIPLIDKNKKIVDYVSRIKFRDIPINKPDLSGNEMNYVADCLNSTFISSQGKYIKIFEDNFKKYYKSNYSLAVSSCTSGLMLVLKCLNLKKDDEVIVPNVTFASPINSILHIGAKPVLCDIDNKNFTIKIESLKKLITKKTKAIICVHTYGHPCKMDIIKKIANKNKIKIIEDCAEAIGTKYNGEKIGRIGNFSVFSFFGNKTLTTGEGGMVLFKSRKDFEDCRILRDHGMTPKKKYWHDKVGFNFRMTNMQAAVGVAQLEKVNYLVKEKIKIAKIYDKFLKKSPLITIPKEEKWATHSYWLYNVIIKDINEKKRDKVINELIYSGIEARPMFYPASDMSIYKQYNKSKEMEKISYQGISLPSFIGLKEEDIIRISKRLITITGNLVK